MDCLVDSLVWLPRAELGESEAEICQELTIQPKAYQGEAPEPIVTYQRDPSGEWLGVPLWWGVKRVSLRDGHGPCHGSRIAPRRLPTPYHERVANPEAQAAFFADMLREVMGRGVIMAEAPTGTGKTVTALHTAGVLGLTTLVIVPTKAIARQWRQEIALHLGFTEDEIGLVEEGCAVWEGKSIVVAVIHNLVQRGWPAAFYAYFGLTIWDECHTLGARSFSQSMYLFPSRYKVGMSATPDRADGCRAIFANYFGEPCVVSQAEALPTICYVLPYRKKGGPYPPQMPKSRQISCLALDMERNKEIIAYTILSLYKKNRNILAVSDRVEHLQVAMFLCYEAGIPEAEMGLFVSQWVNEDGRKIKSKAADLERIKCESRIIFATYQMFQMAIDVPRLDAGIDMTPRSEGTQMIGRIRRPFPDKPLPVWFTIRDGGIILNRMTNARLKHFRANNVQVIENGQTTYS